MGVRDELIALPHDEVTGTASDVDPVIGVGGVAENAFVLFIERVHLPPRKRDAVVECCTLTGRVDVLPSAMGCDLATAVTYVEPFCFAKVAVPSPVVRGL
jgi:hypothetical protein